MYVGKGTHRRVKENGPRLWKKTKYDLWYMKYKRVIIPSKKRRLKKKIKYLAKTKKMNKDEIKEIVQPKIDEI